MHTTTQPRPTSGGHETARILIVEDDDATRDSLARGLELDGHDVATAASVRAARESLRRNRADVILLDVALPDQSGYQLLREIRAARIGEDILRRDVPVLMLSGHGCETDRVRGFELGCDDYIVKPYSFTELRGRIAAVLRRTLPEADDAIDRIGELTIDRRGRTVQVNGRPVMLTIKEWGLLLALADDPTRVFSRDELLTVVWGYRSAGTTRTLDAHACRLRGKLAVAGTRRYVVNLWGVGYRLIDPVAPPIGPSGSLDGDGTREAAR
ncbi:MAG: response regulator transcription factor [Solirubrobacterales bacterium]